MLIEVLLLSNHRTTYQSRRQNIAINCEATYHLEVEDLAKTRNPAP